jgi:hypothetical protein
LALAFVDRYCRVMFYVCRFFDVGCSLQINCLQIDEVSF